MKPSDLHKKRTERLIGIERAIHREPRPNESYDDRLLGVVEALAYHVGLLQENHNALAHTVRIDGNAKKGPVVSSGLILPPGVRR